MAKCRNCHARLDDLAGRAEARRRAGLWRLLGTAITLFALLTGVAWWLDTGG